MRCVECDEEIEDDERPSYCGQMHHDCFEEHIKECGVCADDERSWTGGEVIVKMVACVSLFREFLTDHFRGQTASLATIYEAVQKHFPEDCSDDELCTHEAASRPEWQHKVRQALDYLHNKQKSITQVTRGEWRFPS